MINTVIRLLNGSWLAVVAADLQGLCFLPRSREVRVLRAYLASYIALTGKSKQTSTNMDVLQHNPLTLTFINVLQVTDTDREA